jgi:hypothetical protein
LLSSSKIEAQTSTVAESKITLFKDNDQTLNAAKSISSQVIALFQKIIKVANVNYEKGSLFRVNFKTGKTLFSAEIVTIRMDDIAIFA